MYKSIYYILLTKYEESFNNIGNLKVEFIFILSNNTIVYILYNNNI